MASPLQFFIQVVQHQVGEQWRQWTALRGAFLRRFPLGVEHDATFQIPVDELKDPAILGSSFDFVHQLIVIDAVKELLQVHVDHPFIAVVDVFLRLGYRLVGRALGPKAIAAMGEGSVPLRL